MDPAKVAQMVNVLNGLSARDALCLLVGCMLTVLDEAPSDEERQQSLHNCIDLLKGFQSVRRTKDSHDSHGQDFRSCRRVASH
jgi:hypothetical protein